MLQKTDYKSVKNYNFRTGSGKAIQKIYSEFEPAMHVNLEEISAEHGMVMWI
jgi:hypothetical protein